MALRMVMRQSFRLCKTELRYQHDAGRTKRRMAHAPTVRAGIAFSGVVSLAACYGMVCVLCMRDLAVCVARWD